MKEELQVEENEQQSIIRLRGSLDTTRASRIWPSLNRVLRRPGLRRLVIDLEGVKRIDSAGAALLRIVRKTCSERRIACENLHVPSEAQDFLQFTDEQSQAEAELPQQKEPDPVTQTGVRTIGLINAGRDLAEFTGRFLLTAVSGLRHPHRIRVRETLYQLQKAGAEATFFVSGLSMLMGFIMGIQATTTLTQFGAEIRIADVVTIGTVKEMAPLLMAVIISGRSGASFTAEIGTMKIRQEIDALRVMGFEPMDLLVLPRVLGLAMAGPLLTLIADASGVVGGMFVGWKVLDLSLMNFLSEVSKVMTMTDFIQGVLKGTVFACLIGINGCFHGLRTGTAAEDVGIKTTTSVVGGILLIVLSDALLSGIFHVYD